MNRSLTRNILRAAHRTPRSDQRFAHLVEVDITFAAGAFTDAPAPWSPGEGFREVAGAAWIGGNADGTQTAVVAGVGPKELPAAGGGVWTDEEVWTVTSVDTAVFAWLDDKPDRVTWALGREDVEIERLPYSAHPHKVVADYWHEFYMEHGFIPERLAGGMYGLTLACAPNHSWEYGPRPLADACRRVVAAFGGRAAVRAVTREEVPEWRTPAPVSLMRNLATI
ncbi:hypothetical protein ACWGJT_03190 [Streptomyces xantholiticus]